MPAEIEYHCIAPGCRNSVVVGTPHCRDHKPATPFVQACIAIDQALQKNAATGTPDVFLCTVCTEPNPHVHEASEDEPTMRADIRNAARARELPRQEAEAMAMTSVRKGELLCVADGCLNPVVTNDGRCEDHQVGAADYTGDAVTDLRDQLAQSEETITRLETMLKSRDEAIREQSEEIGKLVKARGESAITRPLTLDDMDELSARLKGNGVRSAVFDGSLYGNPLKLSIAFEATKPARETY